MGQRPGTAGPSSLTPRALAAPAGVALAAGALGLAVAVLSYTTSPAVALGLPVAAGGAAAVLARPMVGVWAGVLAAPLEFFDFRLGGRAGLSATEAILVVTAAAALLHALAGTRALKPQPAHLALAALIMVMALGLTVAGDTFVVFKITLMWTVFLVVSVLVAGATRAELEWTLVAMGAAGAVVSLVALSGAGPIELARGGAEAAGRLRGGFTSPNLLAFFLILTFPPAVAMSVGGRPLLRPPMALSAVLAIVALLLTLSRGGIVGAIVAGVVLMTWPRFRRAAATLLVFVAVLAAVGAVPVARSPEAALIAARVSSVFGDESTANPRIRLYEGTPQIIADHPLIGIGAGNFPVVSPRYGLRDRGAESFEHAHNIGLTIAAEAGLLGLACFLAFLVSLLRPAAVVLRTRRSPLYPVGIGAVAAVAGLLATGILDYPLRSNLLSAFALIATGAIVAAARRARGTELEA